MSPLPTRVLYYHHQRIDRLLRYTPPRDGHYSKHQQWWPEPGEWRDTDRISVYWATGDGCDVDDITEEEARERFPDAF